MKISYAITVCDEIDEIQKLLPHILKHKREEDEIIVLADNLKSPSDVNHYLSSYELEDQIKYVPHNGFKNDFARWKNYINQYCSGDYIFQIDADEIPHEFLLQNLPKVLEDSNVDLIYVSRINTVKGLTQEHIRKWGWKLNEKGWVNFPDRQSRIYKNSKDIKWVGNVHETIQGYKTYSNLPKIEEWCLYHHKTIKKQEQQNEFYGQI